MTHCFVGIAFFANTHGLNYVNLARRTEVDELVVSYFGFKMH